MRIAQWILAGTLGFAAGTAVIAADGLIANVDNLPWARWQGRISLGSEAPVWRSSLAGFESSGLRPGSLSLMADRYFDDTGPGGGFRATSGVIVGPRSSWWTGQPGLAAGDGGLRIDPRAAGGARAGLAADAAADTLAALPYVGLGYTGLASRSGWSFSADLGMLATTAGALRFGRAAGASLATDEQPRDSRWAPAVQLGVSRSF